MAGKKNLTKAAPAAELTLAGCAIADEEALGEKSRRVVLEGHSRRGGGGSACRAPRTVIMLNQVNGPTRSYPLNAGPNRSLPG